MMRKILIATMLLGSQLGYAMEDGPYNDRSPWNGAPGDLGNMNMSGEPMNNLPATLNRPDRDWHPSYSLKEYDFQRNIIDVTEKDKKIKHLHQKNN